MTDVSVFFYGHSGVAGNVRADHWARMSHQKPNVTHVNVGYRELLPMIRKSIKEKFAELWHDFRPTLLKEVKPNVGHWMSSSHSNRREEIILARLRLGHTLLTHRHILDREPPPICDRCRCTLDVPHILLHCRKFCAERQNLETECLLSDVQMNVASLLGNEFPLITDAVFAYLMDCGVAQRV